MSIILYHDVDNQPRHREFSEKIRIGSNSKYNDIVLPKELGIASRHVVIIRSALNRMPVLVDLAGNDTRVNGRKVIRITGIRHGDELFLGRCKLTVWEVHIIRISAGDKLIGRICPVCGDDFTPGDEVIQCPICPAVHHRNCWFSINLCSTGCGYPVHDTIMDVLSLWVRFERRIEQGSDLLEKTRKDGEVEKKGKFCGAGNRRDQVPFQKNENVAFCPKCESPYHLECWLMLDRCPSCGYGVRELIDKVFLLRPGRSRFREGAVV